MHFDCILPEFSPFRNFKKNIGKLNSLTVRKKIIKKNRPTDPIFRFWSGEGNITKKNFWALLYFIMLTIIVGVFLYPWPHGRPTYSWMGILVKYKKKNTWGKNNIRLPVSNIRSGMLKWLTDQYYITNHFNHCTSCYIQHSPFWSL